MHSGQQPSAHGPRTPRRREPAAPFGSPPGETAPPVQPALSAEPALSVPTAPPPPRARPTHPETGRAAARDAAAGRCTEAQQTRVRWWAFALPIAAFVALFSLIASPARARQAPAEAGNPVLEAVTDVLPQQLLHLFS